MKKIILLGYMGSGKTTVGKLLANSLELPFRDLDDVITTRLHATIPEIFEEKGEIFFRKKEAEILEEILQTPRSLVLASGGGTPCYGNNLDAMLAHGSTVIYLHYSVPALAERLLAQRDQRPMISHISDDDLPEFIGKHLLERSPYYNKADLIIKADGLSPEELLERIRNSLV